jgi:hypothetical protein
MPEQLTLTANAVAEQTFSLDLSTAIESMLPKDTSHGNGQPLVLVLAISPSIQVGQLVRLSYLKTAGCNLLFVDLELSSAAWLDNPKSKPKQMSA